MLSVNSKTGNVVLGASDVGAYTTGEVDAIAADKVDKVAGKGLSTEDFTTTEQTKLSGIEAGAQVNTITGVKGNSENSYRTGNVNLTPANIGAVPTSRTVNSKALSSNITLSASDVSAVPTSRTINDKPLSSDVTLVPSDIGAVPAARTVNSKALSSDITLSASDVGAVPTTREVNGHALSSDVTITASDVGLGNVDNTADADKPVSTATQTALDGKVDTTTTVNGHALSSNVSVTASDVGLGNVDNTSDMDKPVSTAVAAVTGDLSNLTTTAQTSLVAAINELDSDKQDSLTFDSIPTADSNNPVLSKGIKSYIDTAISNYWKTVYPVGAIYISTSSTSPQTLFGGTWTAINNRFLVAQGSSYTAGNTGGNASVSYTPAGSVGSHTLTTSEIPAHTHGSKGGTGWISGHNDANGGWFYQADGTILKANPNVNGYYYTTANIGRTTGAASFGGFKVETGHTHTSVGSGGGHNHGFTGTAATIATVPPYLAVYVWQRTA